MSAADSSSQHKQVIAVVGPTATGKTALAVALAGWLNTEIVSADSQIIYRELTIGTAKPTVEEQRGIPHHMIDVADPHEVYSAATYQTQALAHLEHLWAQQKIPVVAGGTGFYIRALLQADFIPDVPPNPALRQELAEQATRLEAGFLHRRLMALDPERAEALHPNDQVRIIRALEIIEATGQPVPKRSRDKALQVHWIGLTYEDRDLLRQCIDQRIEAMMAEGWLEEVADLVRRYGPNVHALKVAHGYPELVSVVLGQRSLEDALAQIRINIHQYARRQMTWFRRNPDIPWLLCDRLSREDLQNSVKRRITDPDRFGAPSTGCEM